MMMIPCSKISKKVYFYYYLIVETNLFIHLKYFFSRLQLLDKFPRRRKSASVLWTAKNILLHCFFNINN